MSPLRHTRYAFLFAIQDTPLFSSSRTRLPCRHPGRAPPFRHPGRDSEPGSSCPEARFNTGANSEFGGFLDTGSEAGMTTWGESTIYSPYSPQNPTFYSITPSAAEWHLPLRHPQHRRIIPPLKSSQTRLPFGHPGRDSEPGSSCSEARFNTGGDSEYGGFLDTGSEAGMTTWGGSTIYSPYSTVTQQNPTVYSVIPSAAG
ncbi:hypothetical protein IMCC21906_00180 [Spongiibacter sp. IMCC21906]|nr:hypothetical protein IMCC21906_00180 [Spongiibacter sp. IMCC21906]